MEYSIAHSAGMNNVGTRIYPDGRVPWNEPVAPDVSSGDERRMIGRIRMCGYCGSMHPEDVGAAIRAGARGSWADMKYGWPHKAYFDGVPNPHVGLLESRSSGTEKYGDDWVQTRDNHWRDPGKPANATLTWKFYAVHLRDATPEDRTLIETHLGVHFEFTADGQITWRNLAK